MKSVKKVMFESLIQPTLPGLVILGTDTDIGKTLVTCTIANALKSRGLGVGVFKPFASGCRKERGELVSDDAMALAHFSDSGHRLATINPIRFEKGLAPAVAARLLGQEIDLCAINRSIEKIQVNSDVLLVEGVGGLLAPLDPSDPEVSNLDLAVRLNYPVVIVTRPNLGTLNHTAMTVKILQERGVCIAGMVVNRYVVDPYSVVGDPTPEQTELLMNTNLDWLCLMTGLPILMVLPDVADLGVDPSRGQIPEEIHRQASLLDWRGMMDTRGRLG